MKRRTSQGHAMRSIFGRSRVTQRDEQFLGLLKRSPPISRQASIPPSRYFAPSALAAFWLTSWPCTQYTTTLALLGKVFDQSATFAGSLLRAPRIRSLASKKRSLRRTSMTSGGALLRRDLRSSAALMLASMRSPSRVCRRLGRDASWFRRGLRSRRVREGSLDQRSIDGKHVCAPPGSGITCTDTPYRRCSVSARITARG